jgi:hypothetical protein
VERERESCRRVGANFVATYGRSVHEAARRAARGAACLCQEPNCAAVGLHAVVQQLPCLCTRHPRHLPACLLCGCSALIVHRAIRRVVLRVAVAVPRVHGQ